MMQISEAEHDRLMRLDAAVRKMVTQEGDDLCWRDLYEDCAALVGVSFCPKLIENEDAQEANCKAFIRSLKSGPYCPIFVDRALVQVDQDALRAYEAFFAFVETSCDETANRVGIVCDGEEMKLSDRALAAWNEVCEMIDKRKGV